MSSPITCFACGAPLPRGVSENECPACLLKAGMENETVPSDAAAVPDSMPLGEGRATVAAPREALGTLIGRYKLLQEIGEGGFGIVYLAEQQEPVKRKVALKVLKPGMDTREVVARFEAERQALALMDHPNIAQVYDGGATEQGRPYFVMELVKGFPLTKYCDDKQFTTKQRLDLFLDVLSAVQHAHQKGIIHRDLKPSNILVSPHDGKPVIKVIDFGIAKALSMELTSRTLFTGLGQMIGTPQYMSPEQAETNALDVDTRSDVYSLGVVLYELLTGFTPLDGKSLRAAGYAEMQRLIREKEPSKPSTRISTLGEELGTIATQRGTEPLRLRKQIRGDLDWIVMKALEKDRTRRYETANGFAADIAGHLRNEPISAHPPTAGYRFRKLMRRHKFGFAAGAAVALTLVLGIVGTTIGLLQARRAQEHAESEERTAKAAAAAEKRAKEEARTEAAISESVSNFINDDLFGSSDPDKEPDRDLKVRTVLDRAAERLKAQFIDQPLVEASIRLTLAKTYLGLGEYEKAIQLAARGAELRQSVFGERSPETVQAKLILADGYSSAGRSREALRMREESVSLLQESRGTEHPQTLHAKASLASSYFGQGRRDEALRIQEEVLRLRRKVQGVDHPNTIGAMGRLAYTYEHLSRRGEALQMREEVLEMLQKTYGREHPRTLDAMFNLANSYNVADRQGEALHLREEILRLRRKVLGTEHPSTLWAMNNLAISYAEFAGKPDEALKLREETLKLRRKVLGPEHPEVRTSLLWLSSSYFQLGRHEEALRIRQQLLDEYRDAPEPKNAGTVGLMELVADSLAVLRPPGALDLRKRILDARRRILGPEHYDTLRAMVIFAFDLESSHRHEEALALREEALPLMRKVNGPEHSSTLTLLEELARSYLEAGRVDDALNLVREAAAGSSSGTFAALQAGTLQAWFDRDAEYAETVARALKAAADTRQPEVAERAVKLACLRPIADPQMSVAVLALAQRCGSLPMDEFFLPYYRLALGMAEFRCGHTAAAPILEDAIRTAPDATLKQTACFYRAMSLFSQGDREEAWKLFGETEAVMRPPPADVRNPMAGCAGHAELRLWLAFREAWALLYRSQSFGAEGR